MNKISSETFWRLKTDEIVKLLSVGLGNLRIYHFWPSLQRIKKRTLELSSYIFSSKQFDVKLESENRIISNLRQFHQYLNAYKTLYNYSFLISLYEDKHDDNMIGRVLEAFHLIYDHPSRKHN